MRRFPDSYRKTFQRNLDSAIPSANFQRKKLIHMRRQQKAIIKKSHEKDTQIRFIFQSHFPSRSKTYVF